MTETAQPLPSVSDDMLKSLPINQTINSRPDLFQILTPINVDMYESLLRSHPNHDLVNSVCCGLRQGFWPFAAIDPEDPVMYDSPHQELDDQASDFVRAQLSKTAFGLLSLTEQSQ
ncbi:hypothetical protein K439DRAFT_1377845 [Ramaria rubella]|nr:hypothetical protein K439DRAFT_1377845 [Ramaria rubella]